MMISFNDIITQLEEVDNMLERPSDWRIEIAGLHSEIGEFLNELPWRPWRNADKRPITQEDRDKAQKELGDIFGTIIRVAMHVGYTGYDIENAILEHVTAKYYRVARGIDG